MDTIFESDISTNYAEDNILQLLVGIGENPNREGLQETPMRVVKSFKQLFGGYQLDPMDVMKTFDANGHDEIVVLKNVEFYSMCEHHMLPFFGHAHIAYIPNKKVIGVSKLARLLDIYSRRLQIQERLCDQITTALMEGLNPRGAACIIEANHLCMRMRGVEKQNSVMQTSSLKGAFIDKNPEGIASRNELMNLIKL